MLTIVAPSMIVISAVGLVVLAGANPSRQVNKSDFVPVLRLSNFDSAGG